MQLRCPRHERLVPVDIQTAQAYIHSEEASLILVRFFCSVCDDMVMSSAIGQVVRYFPGLNPEPWPHSIPPVVDDWGLATDAEIAEALQRLMEEEDDDA